MIADLIRLSALYVVARVFVEIAMPSSRIIVKYLFWAGAALTIISSVGPATTRFIDDIHSVSTTYSRSKEAVDDGLPGVLSIFKGSWRIPMNGEITQPFKGEDHHGIDIAASEGTPVKCVREGDVVEVKWNDIYGNMIIINHGKGIESVYAHLKGLNVKVGKPVVGGEIIGSCGSTGRSTGPHLHFEIRNNGKAINPKELME